MPQHERSIHDHCQRPRLLDYLPFSQLSPLGFGRGRTGLASYQLAMARGETGIRVTVTLHLLFEPTFGRAV